MPKVLDSFPKIDGGLGQPGESDRWFPGSFPFREKPGEGHQGQSPQNKENLRVPNGWSKQPTTVNRSELVGGIFFCLLHFLGGHNFCCCFLKKVCLVVKCSLKTQG